MRGVGYKLIAALGLAALLLANCGTSTSTSTSVGGTETGTSEAGEISAYASKIEEAASALIPDMSSSGTAESLSQKTITYNTSDDWSTFSEDINTGYLTDIFGPAGEANAPSTRIRILIESFVSTLSTIFTRDSDLSCTGGSTLNESDTIEIAFFGEISNGTSGNRYFGCQSETTSNPSFDIYTEKVIYGQDSSGVLRAVVMQQDEGENTSSVDEFGDYAINYKISYVTYGETLEGGQNVAYLDLNYAQAIDYNGDDGTIDTDDDIIHKNRSRITGRVTLDSSGDPTLGTGDFTITKNDQYIPDGESSTLTTTTMTIGRGSYENESYSLFNIDSDASSIVDASGIYCIQSVTDDLPSYAESANCTSLETATPWSGSTFPFTLSPAIDTDFESKSFYEDNGTDLIDESGSNFTIPDYQTTE